MDVNGTLIWYYNICKREVWLMLRGIVPDQHNDNIEIGRFIHEHSYQRNKKEISFGNVRFDIVFESKNQLIIGETKKSSKYSKASKWQLMYYLKVLKEAGVNAKGVLLYPEERRRSEIILTSEAEEELKEMEEEIEQIGLLEFPPQFQEIHYCKNCGYRDYCFA